MAKKHGRVAKRKQEGGLIITSLIDVFTILVVYLLKNFSAEGNLVSNAENLTLPNSSSTKALKEVNLQIALTSDMVVVDNQPICPITDVKNISNDEPDPVVFRLEDILKKKYAQEEEMVRLGALNQVTGRVILQIDKSIPFDYLFKVINTCGKVGYNEMKLAVMNREE
jgi:biopolymer transport protein ExbD